MSDSEDTRFLRNNASNDVNASNDASASNDVSASNDINASNDVNVSNNDTQSNEEVDHSTNNTPSNNTTSSEIENSPDQLANDNNPSNNTTSREIENSPDQFANNNNLNNNTTFNGINEMENNTSGPDQLANNNNLNNNTTFNGINEMENNTSGPDQLANNNNLNNNTTFNGINEMENNTSGPDQLANNNNHTELKQITDNDETATDDQPFLTNTRESIHSTTNISSKVDVSSHKKMNEPQDVVKKEVTTETLPPTNANTYVKTKAIQQVNTIELGDSHNGIEYTYEKKVYEDKTIQQEHIGSYNDDNSPKHDYTTNSTKVQSQRPANQRLQTSKLFYIFMAFVILIPAYLYSLDKKPTFLQNVAETANTITIGISNLEVPDVNTMNDHIVALRRVANTIDRSPVFKSYGSNIAIGLREYGEKIRDAGGLLRKMYSKGSSVHTSFDIEIEAMIHAVERLNSRKSRRIQDEDARYFKEILERLITKIKDFRRSVEVAHSSILDAEEIKRNNEVAIEKGFKEAEKFSDNEKYSIEISRASNELASVNNFLPYLHTASGQLDKLKTILKNYEDNLRDVSNELDEENGVRFTMSELKNLRHAIDNAKASQHKFNQFAQISD